MVIIGGAFCVSILTLYAFYRSIVQRNEFFTMISHTHFLWQIFYLTCTILIMHAGNIVTSEVCKYIEWIKELENI